MYLAILTACNYSIGDKSENINEFCKVRERGGMRLFIQEATEKALREDCFICRKSAREENMSVFGVIKPTNTYDTCLLLIVKNGKINKGSRWWNPTANDLMADDWEILRDKF